MAKEVWGNKIIYNGNKAFRLNFILDKNCSKLIKLILIANRSRKRLFFYRKISNS